MKFDIWVFFVNLSKEIQLSLKSGKNKLYFKRRINYTLQEEQYILLTISLVFIFRIKNILDKII